MNFTNLKEVSFPVYRISRNRPQNENGVLYYKNTYRHIDTNEIYSVVKILDDQTLKEPNLGRRRLHLDGLGVPLYRLRKAIYYYGDFLRAAKSGYWFIDSSGQVFQYTKTLRAKARCHKIKRIISPKDSMGSIVEVEGIPERFRTIYMAPKGHRYACLLHLGQSRIYYGSFEQPFKETWRMI